MPPLTLAAAIALIEGLITIEPKVETALRNILSKPKATPADWATEKAAVLSESYGTLVPNSSLPPEETK